MRKRNSSNNKRKRKKKFNNLKIKRLDKCNQIKSIKTKMSIPNKIRVE